MTEITKLPDTTGNSGNWIQPESEDASIERMAHKLAPLRSLKGGWDETGASPRSENILRVKDSAQITYSRVSEGLQKLIARAGEVRAMSDVVREQLTREVPKDDLEVAGKIAPADMGPIFEQLARLTLDLSREIERTEKNMALTLAALK